MGAHTVTNINDCVARREEHAAAAGVPGGADGAGGRLGAG